MEKSRNRKLLDLLIPPLPDPPAMRTKAPDPFQARLPLCRNIPKTEAPESCYMRGRFPRKIRAARRSRSPSRPGRRASAAPGAPPAPARGFRIRRKLEAGARRRPLRRAGPAARGGTARPACPSDTRCGPRPLGCAGPGPRLPVPAPRPPRTLPRAEAGRRP